MFWRYNRVKKVYYRWHGTVPHTLSDGTQVSAKNIVVQSVQIQLTDIVDPNGVRSPEVVATGGLAELIAPYADSIQYHEPWLTLHGLRLIFEKNQP